MDAAYDVLIIGGGPAGAAAALTLAKRPELRVLLVDKARCRQSIVGESLSPGAGSLLKYLDVWQEFEAQFPLTQWGNLASWGSDEMQSMDFMNTVHGSGWSLARDRFDSMLVEQAKDRGIEIEFGTQVSRLDTSSNGWDVALKSLDSSQRQVKARFVIDAAGRNSRWSLKGRSLRQRHDNLIGLATWLPKNGERSVPNMTHVEACSYGWWYAAPVSENRVVVALMTDSGIARSSGFSSAENWFHALSETQHIRSICDENCLVPFPEYRREPKVLPAFSSVQVDHEPDLPIVAAGDAAASHDPLSSSGIPMSIATGIQSARVAAAWVLGNQNHKVTYQADIAADFSNYLKSHWQIYRLENRFANEPFWRYRQAYLEMDPNHIVGNETPCTDSSLFVPAPLVRKMLVASRTPVPAHQLVRKLANEHREVPEERIALAVQELRGASRVLKREPALT
ncbi:MAG: FAD-dependent monooxygenase [Planctomycetota bacterium]